MLDIVARDLDSLAHGQFLKCLPNGSPLQVSFGAAEAPWVPLTHLRGDWPAITDLLAVRQWRHRHHPCALCGITQVQMQDPTYARHISLRSTPWAAYTDADLRGELGAHVISVTITTAQMRSELFSLLRSESDKKGGGRVLQADYPSLGLRARDRLEPCSTLSDTHQLETTPVPFETQFWRGGPEHRLRHPSPLFQIRGFGIRRFAVDLLHCWHLGCLQYLLGEILWLVVQSGVLCPAVPWLTAPDKENISMRELRAQVHSYYAAKRKAEPEFARKGSQVA